MKYRRRQYNKQSSASNEATHVALVKQQFNAGLVNVYTKVNTRVQLTEDIDILCMGLSLVVEEY